MNPLKELEQHGQSVWLDFLSRGFVQNGGLSRLINEDGVNGVTSNPSIFEKAIAGSDEYDAAITEILRNGDIAISDLYQRLAVEDIQNASDVLYPVYVRTEGRDGFVSIEVSPYLAHDTEGTLKEARLLWSAIGRENLMIKVPGTPSGLAAIRALIAEGINVNVTLLFSLEMYVEVAEAYLAGLERRAKNGGDLHSVASVASFFISRIDTAVDKLIDEKLALTRTAQDKKRLAELRGRVAVANAKIAYAHYMKIFAGSRWQRLAEAGAKPQRLLWASTGTKNKDYSDVLYVEELIGADTVNTMPPATLDAFRDHGCVKDALEQGQVKALKILEQLANLGISLKEVTDRLSREGVSLFSDAADTLFRALAEKRERLLGSGLNAQIVVPGERIEQHFRRVEEEWRVQGTIRRIWSRDTTVWKGTHDEKLLGWLDSVQRSASKIDGYRTFAEEVSQDGFTDVVLLGMGGSSLGPVVLSEVLGMLPGLPLHVIDSTDPSQIRNVEEHVNLNKSLFIVSSKSGTTIETDALTNYFAARVSKAMDGAAPGKHFVAITDPGSPLEERAIREGFRKVFRGDPTIGGRFSVLSPFGLVPAALSGVDLRRLVRLTESMIHSCGPDVPPAVNPAVRLGLLMGIAGLNGLTNITILSSADLQTFRYWAEQLIAESTGKDGKGLIPIVDEPLGSVRDYGADRLFIDLSSGHCPSDPERKLKLEALRIAGYPVVQIHVRSRENIGQEFFRFELATAVAGAVLGVNPFDQPDVESSKVRTRELMAACVRNAPLSQETAVASNKNLVVYANSVNGQALRDAGAFRSVESWLTAHFSGMCPGNYIAILAYLPMNDACQDALNGIREALFARTKVPTTIGFGPRYLHSTGQAHKGGPASGVFLELTTDRKDDLPIPGYPVSFGVLQSAQAQGDYDILASREQRILRVHLKGDTQEAMRALALSITNALN